MVEIRQLQPEEFDVLTGIAEGIKPDPGKSLVLVGDEKGDIVCRTMLIALTHIEGTWIREDHRGGRLGKRLIESAESAARDIGIKKLFAYTDTDQNGDYMQRLGYQKSSFVVWTKEL